MTLNPEIQVEIGTRVTSAFRECLAERGEEISCGFRVHLVAAYGYDPASVQWGVINQTDSTVVPTEILDPTRWQWERRLGSNLVVARGEVFDSDYETYRIGVIGATATWPNLPDLTIENSPFSHGVPLTACANVSDPNNIVIAFDYSKACEF